MNRYKLNGRPVELDITTEDGEPYVMAGNYADGEMEYLTDAECDEACGQNYDELYADLLSSAIDRAQDYADVER